MTIIGDVVSLRDRSLGKNVNHYTRKVLFASATNKTSSMKQKLQEAGAEIYQIPTFKR